MYLSILFTVLGYLPSFTGSYSYTFNNEGTYFISSGKVDHPDWGNVEMKQSVIVQTSQSKANTVNVTVGGYEAEYNVGKFVMHIYLVDLLFRTRDSLRSPLSLFQLLVRLSLTL